LGNLLLPLRIITLHTQLGRKARIVTLEARRREVDPSLSLPKSGPQTSNSHLKFRTPSRMTGASHKSSSSCQK
jgi:hypothetical protein